MKQKYIKQQTNSWYRMFRRMNNWEYKDLRRWQLAMLRFLGWKFGIKVHSWKDFYNLPLTNKSDLRKWKVKNTKNLTEHYTSGSTGEPLRIYGPECLQFIKAAIFIRVWENVGWDHKRPILRLTAGKPRWKKADSFYNIFPMNYRTISKKYADWIIKNKPFLIHGGSGSIREITTILKKSEKGLNVMKKVNLFLMSEDTHQHKRKLKKYWKKVYSGYGCAELCTVASECSHHCMHVNMETCIVESINGELVITDLFNDVTPVIRYRTKDLGTVRWSNCRCGLKHQIISNLVGRGVGYYDGPEVKKPLSWWVLSPITHRYSDIIKQWKVIVYPKKFRYELHVVWNRKKDKLNWYKNFVEKKTGLVFKVITHKRMTNKQRQNLMEIK